MTAWIENPFDNLPAEGFRPQRYWLMAEAFARAGHRAVLWTSDFSHAEKRRRRFVSPLADAPFEVRLVPTRPYSGNVSLGRVASHMAYARAWRDLALAAPGPAPDVIVASMPPLSTGKVALELARRFGAKLVADMQDAWPETFLRLAPRPLRPVAKAALAPLSLSARRLLRGADLVTGVCDRYRDMALGAGAKDYRRAYLGMRLPPRPPARRPGQPLRIVYAGGIGRTYDLATVLDALAMIEGATLDIAGKGECEATLRARCVRSGPMRARTRAGWPRRSLTPTRYTTATSGLSPPSRRRSRPNCRTKPVQTAEWMCRSAVALRRFLV